MGETRITVDGKQYKSPEEMPPEVRRQYDAAMQMMGSALASAQGGGTRVDTTSRSHGAEGDVVIQRTITMNTQTYKNSGEMPAGLNLGGEAGPRLRTFLNINPSPALHSLPLQRSNAPSEGRRFVYDLAFWVIVGLALWFWLGRY